MSLFAFPEIEREQNIPFGKIDVPFGQWSAFRFSENVTFGSGRALVNMGTELLDSSELLPPDKANQLYGVDDLEGLPGSGIKYDKPVREETAKNRQLRKYMELEMLNVRELAAHSEFGLKAFGSFALGAIPGSMADPLDFALNLIPFVGSATKAEIMAKAGASTFRQKMAAGLLTSQEKLARFTKYPALSGAVANAALGNLAAEIPVAIQAHRDQRIYGLVDSAANVGVGAVAGAALHGFGRLFETSAKSIAAATPSTRTAALRKFIGDELFHGEDGNVKTVLETDPRYTATKVVFDEVAAREAAALEAEGKYTKESAELKAMLDSANVKQANADDLLKLLTFTSKSSPNEFDKKIASKLLDRFQSGERTVDLFEQAAKFFDLRYNPEVRSVDPKGDALVFQAPVESEKVIASRQAKETRKQLFALERAYQELFERLGKETDVTMQSQLKLNAHRLKLEIDKLKADYDSLSKSIEKPSDVLAAHEIAEHSDLLRKAGRFPDLEELKAKAAQLQAFIDEQVEVKKAELMAESRSRFNSVEQQKITSQKATKRLEAIGRHLTEDEVSGHTLQDKIDEQDIKVMDEDAAAFEKSAKAEIKDAEGNVIPMTPYERSLLKEANEIEPETKAVQAATDCLINNGLF